MKKAVVIIPTYNERENVTKVSEWLLTVFKDIKTWDMHVLIVDDMSPDKTYEVVEELSKKHRNIHLHLNKKKGGLGAAYLKGMEEAFTDLKADAVFEFDADLSHDATRIPEFLKKLDEGYDLVLGSRYIPGGSIPKNWGWHRKFLSVVGNIVIAVILGNFSIRDWTTGFRAIKKAVYEAVAPELTGERFSGYTFQIGFLQKAVRNKFKVAEVPFHFVDRTIGTSKLGTEYIKNTMIYILKVRILEILNHRLFKFVVVGGVGAFVQLASLAIYRRFFPYQIAFFAAIESAVVSNFIFNNLWTFSDRKLSLPEIPTSFIKFNLASSGSIIIQQLVAILGEVTIGLPLLFTLPIVSFAVDMGHVYAVLGILLGMFWNFFAYNRFVWKKK